MSDEVTAPTAPDLEVEALVEEHHDAGGCTWVAFNIRGERGICAARTCNGAQAIRRAVEAGRALGERSSVGVILLLKSRVAELEDAWKAINRTVSADIDDQRRLADAKAEGHAAGLAEAQRIDGLALDDRYEDGRLAGAREAYEVCARMADPNTPEGVEARRCFTYLRDAIRAQGGTR